MHQLRLLLPCLLALGCDPKDTSNTPPPSPKTAVPASESSPAEAPVSPTPSPAPSTATAETSANPVAKPASPAPSTPPQPGDSTGDQDPELAKRVEEKFKKPCRLERRCNDILGVDCNAATDGPYHYVKADTLEIITTCGGACMARQCTDCPPKGWNCPVY